MENGSQPERLIPIRRRDGEPPCGECHLQAGEVCDICGAMQLLPSSPWANAPLIKHADGSYSQAE